MAALLLSACGRVDRSTGLDPLATSDALAGGIADGGRSGVLIRGAGGSAAYERLTAVDSATGRYLTVIRPRCASRPCAAPLDSAAGTLPPDEVRALFALAEDERLAALDGDHGACGACADPLFYTVTVRANGRRAVVRADSETMPAPLRRFQAAVAESIREVRAAR